MPVTQKIGWTIAVHGRERERERVREREERERRKRERDIGREIERGKATGIKQDHKTPMKNNRTVTGCASYTLRPGPICAISPLRLESVQNVT